MRDIGDEDLVAFFATLMQVKDVVSERAYVVLLPVDVSRMEEVDPPLPLQLFSGSTLELGSSRGIRCWWRRCLRLRYSPPRLICSSRC